MIAVALVLATAQTVELKLQPGDSYSSYRVEHESRTIPRGEYSSDLKLTILLKFIRVNGESAGFPVLGYLEIDKFSGTDDGVETKHLKKIAATVEEDSMVRRVGKENVPYWVRNGANAGGWATMAAEGALGYEGISLFDVDYPAGPIRVGQTWTQKAVIADNDVLGEARFTNLVGGVRPYTLKLDSVDTQSGTARINFFLDSWFQAGDTLRDNGKSYKKHVKLTGHWIVELKTGEPVRFEGSSVERINDLKDRHLSTTKATRLATGLARE